MVSSESCAPSRPGRRNRLNVAGDAADLPLRHSIVCRGLRAGGARSRPYPGAPHTPHDDLRGSLGAQANARHTLRLVEVVRLLQLDAARLAFHHMR